MQMIRISKSVSIISPTAGTIDTMDCVKHKGYQAFILRFIESKRGKILITGAKEVKDPDIESQRQ